MTAGGPRPAVLAWVSTGARVVLAGILSWAGAAKAVDPVGSVQSVQAYELLPDGVARLVGLGLPFLEIGLALLLLLGLATRFAAGVTAVLMLVFIAGVASAWARGLSIDCGCFGTGGQIDPSETRYLQEILRDLGFLALAVWLLLFPASRFALDRHGRHEPAPHLPHVPHPHPDHPARHVHRTEEESTR